MDVFPMSASPSNKAPACTAALNGLTPTGVAGSVALRAHRLHVKVVLGSVTQVMVVFVSALS
jgi:hypothetical protein